MNFYNKNLTKIFLLWNNISNNDRNSNGNSDNNKYKKTPAITLSATRIRAITTLESATAK